MISAALSQASRPYFRRYFQFILYGDMSQDAQAIFIFGHRRFDAAVLLRAHAYRFSPHSAQNVMQRLPSIL